MFQAALAFHAVNDAAREGQAVQLLGRRTPPTGLNVGGQLLSLDDLHKEIARWPLSVAIASPDWPMFRGDARRSGRAEGDFPLLEPRESIKPITLPAYEEVSRALAAPANALPVGASGPALPGLRPPRRRRQDHLPRAGRPARPRRRNRPENLEPRSAPEPPLPVPGVGSQGRQPATSELLGQWLPKYAGLASLLDENATLGTLSSDGRHVFYVEDVPVPAHPNDVVAIQQPQGPQGIGHPYFSSLEETLYHNRLRAVDVQTGEFRWEVGSWEREKTVPPPRPEFVNVFFLGPPLPVGRRLFALVEQTAQDQFPPKNKDIILLCLDPDTGRLIWSQDIASVPDALWLDPTRRMQPVQLAYGDGVLDLPHQRRLRRGRRSAHARPAAGRTSTTTRRPTPTAPPASRSTSTRRPGGAPPPSSRAIASLLTAPDGDSILCLNLRDGAQVWSPAHDGRPYIARRSAVAHAPPPREGRQGDKVLSSAAATAAPSASPRATRWEGLLTGAPSGLGTACGKHFLLPLRQRRRPRHRHENPQPLDGFGGPAR